jgi:hypothetical protein
LPNAIAITPAYQALLLSSDCEILFSRKYPYQIDDFYPQIMNGKLYYSFLDYNAGKRTVLDEDFHVIKKLPWHMEMYGFLMLGDDHYIFIDSEKTHSSPGNCFITDMVREYDHGKLIFNLSAWDVLARKIPYRHLVLRDPWGESCVEAFHFGSIQALPHHRLLLSLGNDGVVMIDRRTKKILWAFGGDADQFGLTSDVKPGVAHDAKFDDTSGKLLLFINNLQAEEASGKPMSSIAEFTLDPATHTLKKSEFKSAESFYSKYMGSVEEKNGIYSVGGGELFYGKYLFYEIANLKAHFKIWFDDQNGERIKAWRVYRLP